MSSIQDSLKLYFLIAPALYLVNMIISISFACKYRNDSIYRKSAQIWFFYLLLGISQGVLQESTLQIKTIAWSIACFVTVSSMGIFVADVFKIKNNVKKDSLLFISALTGTLILYKFEYSHFWSSIGATFFGSYPILKFTPQLFKSKKTSFSKIGLLICFGLIALHGVDYAYAAEYPELLFPGYLLALMLAVAASCFTYAVLVERVILENEILELLQNTARLTALGGMAAEISHEIKNPLTVLSVNNSFMLQKINSGDGNLDIEYYQNKLEISDKMVKRMLIILNSLQSHYNSGAADNFKIKNLVDIFDEAQLICDFRAKKNGITVTFSLDPENIAIECRSVQLVQVIQNIVQNAIDEISSIESPKIEVLATLVDPQTAKITINDNGPGIPEDVRPHIFNSFFTTKSSDNGSGLGLSISKRLIEEHSGSLTIDSGPQTSFVIILPLTQKFKKSGLVIPKSS